MADIGEPDFAPGEWQPAPPDADWLGPRGLPVTDSADLTRILNLPRRPVVTEVSATAAAYVHLGMQRYSRGPRACDCRRMAPERFTNGRDGCLHTLLWQQAWMLHEMGLANGMLASMSVGSGKTLAWLLAPLAIRNCRLALLLIPPTLTGQIMEDYLLVAEHFRVPNIAVHKGERQTQEGPVQRRPDGTLEPTLHVLPYSRLSSVRSSEWVANLRPDLIIADEADALGSLQSARTLRIMRFFQHYGDATRFVAGTGTLTDSQLTEFSHLAALALRWGSPMPLDPQVTAEWNQCLGAVPNPCPIGALTRLLEPGEPTANIRRAFRRRLAETPGMVMVSGRQVVISPSTGQEVRLSVRERPAPPIPPIVQRALEMVRDNVRPDTLAGGEDDAILADAKDQVRCACEVACGLFYKDTYPNGEPPWLRGQWREARKLWNQELLRKRLRGEAHLDSAKLCENAARRAHGDAPRTADLPEWPAEHWTRWRDIMDKVHPVTVAVRLDSFLVDDAVQWAVQNKGIVWYTISEFARWMAARVREIYGRELTVYGAATGDTIIKQAGIENRSIIASLDAHGRGRDKLQFLFSTQLFANCPSSDKRWHQGLARAHRRGQDAEEVTSWVYQHTPELQKALDQALRRGEYVRDVTGEDRKLLDAWEG